MGAKRGAVDAVMASVDHDLGQRHRHRFPDTGLAPSTEPAIDRVPVTVFGRHIAPRDATAHPPEDAIDDRAVVLWSAPAPTVCGLYRQQPFQNAPFRFGKIAPAQACPQKIALNQPLGFASTASCISLGRTIATATDLRNKFAYDGHANRRSCAQGVNAEAGDHGVSDLVVPLYFRLVYPEARISDRVPPDLYGMGNILVRLRDAVFCCAIRERRSAPIGTRLSDSEFVHAA